METFENSQLEHTRLLRSRDTWTSTQAYEFAILLEKEIDIRKDLESAKKALANLEAEQLTSMHNYMNHLRRRYHEEQLWQDKWRVYSTYGTWFLLVFNSMVFLISQYMTRIRESQRMKDVKEMVFQSMMANEGTLRAIQEQQQQMQDHRQQKNNGKEERQTKDRNMTSEEVGNLGATANEAKVFHSIATISTNEASALVADEGDMHEKANNLSEHTTITPLSSLQKLWSNLNKYASCIKVPRKITLLPGSNDDNGKKMTNIEVDVPSVILGASVAGIAWIVATFAAPSRS